MKGKTLSLTILMFSLVLVGLIFLKLDEKKIAYVDTSKLLGEFSESIKAQGLINKKKEEYNSNLIKINDSLNATMAHMKKNFNQAKPTAQEAMKKKLSKWNDDYRRYSQAAKDNMAKDQREIMSPVISKLNSFLKSWGKENGYDMILGTTQAGNIVYADEGMNVTSQVVDALNYKYQILAPKK